MHGSPWSIFAICKFLIAQHLIVDSASMASVKDNLLEQLQ